MKKVTFDGKEYETDGVNMWIDGSLSELKISEFIEINKTLYEIHASNLDTFDKTAKQTDPNTIINHLNNQDLEEALEFVEANPITLTEEEKKLIK